MEFHYETRPQTNFVISSPRAGRTVFSKFVWSPSIMHSCLPDDGFFYGFRAYAVRLEALRPLGSRNLKGWKASGFKVPKA